MIGVNAVPRIKLATTTPWATTAGRAHVHAHPPTSPCRFPRPDDQRTIIFADASGTIGVKLAAGGAALELRPDAIGQLRQHHLTKTTIFGASSHGELKTLAIIVDAVTTVSKAPQDQPHHVFVVIDAAGDFQILRRLARQSLHKAIEFSLGTHTLLLWVALRNLRGQKCPALDKTRVPSLHPWQQTHRPTCTQPTRGAHTNPVRAPAGRPDAQTPPARTFSDTPWETAALGTQ